MQHKSTFQAGARAPLRTPMALALAIALGLVPLAVSAATISVTSPNDTDPTSTATCTLRQAIVSMNNQATAGTGCVNSGDAFGSSDTIVFDTGTFPNGGSNTITLADAADNQLNITATDLTIDATANRQVTIQRDIAASNNFRIMYDSAASGDSLTLKHLTLVNGNGTTTNCYFNHGGGGICIPDADLTLSHTTVSGNLSSFSGGGIYTLAGSIMLTHSTVSGNSTTIWYGGGIASSSGAITLSNSTVSDNSASAGGGIFSHSSVTLVNSTLSGNTATNSGGGISASGGNVTLINSTLSGNLASYGGAIFVSESITLTNSTVSGNSAVNVGGIYAIGNLTANNAIIVGNIGGDIKNGTTPSGSRNLIGTVANLNLGPLQDNGGPTQTMLPQAGSPAIDAGACHNSNVSPSDGIPTVDQRGMLRPDPTSASATPCDIGAVEVNSIPDLIFQDGFDSIPDVIFQDGFD